MLEQVEKKKKGVVIGIKESFLTIAGLGPWFVCIRSGGAVKRGVGLYSAVPIATVYLEGDPGSLLRFLEFLFSCCPVTA